MPRFHFHLAAKTMVPAVCAIIVPNKAERRLFEVLLTAWAS